MELRRVEGATNDNISYRPDLFNPLFADDLMPKIAAVSTDWQLPSRLSTDRFRSRPVCAEANAQVGPRCYIWKENSGVH